MMDKHLSKEGEGRVGWNISWRKIPLCHYMGMEQKTKDKRDIGEYNKLLFYLCSCAYERDGETRCINGYLFIPETQCLDLRKEIDILFLFVWQWSF